MNGRFFPELDLYFHHFILEFILEYIIQNVGVLPGVDPNYLHVVFFQWHLSLTQLDETYSHEQRPLSNIELIY